MSSRLPLVAVAVCALALACSSEGVAAGPLGSGRGPGVCFLSLPISGGITGTLEANGCGTIGDSLTWSELASLSGGGTSTRLTMVLGSPVEPLVTGPLDVTRLEIRTTEPAPDGGDIDREWSTPDGACTAALTSNVFDPTTVFENRHVLEGNASCRAPAEPAEGNDRGAVTLGPFTFGGFVDP